MTKNQKITVIEAFDLLAIKMDAAAIKIPFAEANNSCKYVADMETHEVIWMNDTLAGLVAIDWHGKKCHELLHDWMAPCGFCVNNDLLEREENEIIEWLHYNKKFGKHFIVNDFRRVIGGRNYRYETAIDITCISKELLTFLNT